MTCSLEERTLKVSFGFFKAEFFRCAGRLKIFWFSLDRRKLKEEEEEEDWKDLIDDLDVGGPVIACLCIPMPVFFPLFV